LDVEDKAQEKTWGVRESCINMVEVVVVLVEVVVLVSDSMENQRRILGI